jgi:hypothetical protein
MILMILNSQVDHSIYFFFIYYANNPVYTKHASQILCAGTWKWHKKFKLMTR